VLDASKIDTILGEEKTKSYVNKSIFTPIDFDKIVLKEVRSRPEYKALAKALGIESKDAPIIRNY